MDLYGKRSIKYPFLLENTVSTINWEVLDIREPYYFFVPKNFEEEENYNKGFLLNEIFTLSNAGLVTSRDKLIVQDNKEDVKNIINDFNNLKVSEIREKYILKDSRDWTVEGVKNDIINTNCDYKNIIKIDYRPFDFKFLYYTNKSKGFISYPRYDILRHLKSENIALISTKLLSSPSYNHSFLSKNLIDKCTISNRGKESNYVFPLYLYPDKNEDGIFDEEVRKPNLDKAIIEEIGLGLGLTFINEKPKASTQQPLNSPPLEGCPKGGVVLNEPPPIPTSITTINNTPIIRNFVENLPYNAALSQLAKDKRKAGILGEVLFWQQVHKGKFHNIDFDRQRIIGNYIVDFYVKTLGLVIEIDGSSHDNKADYDAERQAYLENLGLKFYRITDNDVKKNIGSVMQGLENYIVGEYGESATPVCDHPSKGGTTPVFDHPSKGGEFAPIDVLDYIYAVLHSPSYREKYKEFLKIDFPRVPYPKDAATFWQLVQLGGEIRKIHLLESPVTENYITSYPKDGDNVISTKIGKKDWELYDTKNQLGRIWINEDQYFDAIPLVAWEFYIGGYQPAQKWLKDRKQRELKFEDILHYQKIIVALTETDRLMKAIDTVALE